MKLLFIGGTGLISSACSELAIQNGHELFLLNRSASKKYPTPSGAKVIQADIQTDFAQIAKVIEPHHFDAVVDFIAFTPQDIERDIQLFRNKTNQFVFISSASAYQKPVKKYLITEETPLENPFWEYSRNKIACENLLMNEYENNHFPVTIIRPSLTYGPSQIPLCTGSWSHPWTLINRMKQGKSIIVPGDGTSLWVLTWNQDFAIGLIGLLGNQKTIGEAFQITSDEVLTWDQIYLEVYQALGANPNIVHIPSDFIAKFNEHAIGSLIGDKANSVVFDNSKIKRFVPEYHCKVTWSEGLRRSLAWFESHPEFQTIDHDSIQMMEKILEVYNK